MWLPPIRSSPGSVSIPGWLTIDYTDPFSGQFFFGDHDPAVEAVAAQERDLFAPVSMPSGLAATLPGASGRIMVPVLLVGGSKDLLGCGDACRDTATLAAAESRHFAPGLLHAWVLPGGGDMINLSLGTQRYQAEVADWMRTLR